MPLLTEQVDAHAHVGDGVSAVELADALDAVEIVSGQLTAKLFAVVVRQRSVPVDAGIHEVPAHAELHGQPAHKMHVRRVHLMREVYDLLNVHMAEIPVLLFEGRDGLARFRDGGNARKHQFATAVFHRLE